MHVAQSVSSAACTSAEEGFDQGSRHLGQIILFRKRNAHKVGTRLWSSPQSSWCLPKIGNLSGHALGVTNNDTEFVTEVM